MKKILISIAPVSHTGIEIPAGVNNPVTPEQVASEVIACTRLGAAMVHLHVRDDKGEQTADLSWFRKTIDLFKNYAGQYGFDYLMITAQAYQESQIDQNKTSPDGAIGVMQVLPSTAADKNVNISNIHELENNIHAGTKYLRFISDRYFADDSIDPQNRLLLSFASYNAGPVKIVRLRKEAEEQGLDPNKWFQNVELVAAKRIGRETVHYVSNIYKYWIAYSMVLEREKVRKEASGG